jgi:hypothetical protein
MFVLFMDKHSFYGNRDNFLLSVLIHNYFHLSGRLKTKLLFVSHSLTAENVPKEFHRVFRRNLQPPCETVSEGEI